MPVRKIPKNYRNVTGIAAHSKAAGQAMFESTLERDFITLLEFDRGVDQFEVQPLVIQWMDAKGKTRTYTPDVLVWYSAKGRKPVIFEVKYRDDLRQHWQEYRPKFKAAVRFAKAQGWRFKIVSEQEIRSQKLENAKFLLPFVRKGPANEPDMDLLAGKLRALGKTTPKALLEAAYSDEWNRARLLPTLWYLVGTHQIGFDINQKLTMASMVWSIHS